ncbi:MAG TPA: Gfo/Idh/MocA family oxidoreductase [Gemmataceae bacterium]|nr:Gfo/Idh/MocA family oxidoreductase [Gemmataceae bacterium]
MASQSLGDEVGLAVIGCGGFGLFALQHFAQVGGVKLVGMAGTHRPAALAAARRFGIPDVEDVAALVRRDDVNLVYIATPPFLHHSQAMTALEAGKHVICEKPLALTVAQADEMVAAARRNGRLLVANLMQRYNPLFDAVRQMVRSRVLGDFLHGTFENYASDENLPADHWFWDRPKSGGIFVEHGVHFFDLFDGWLGDGRVEAAQCGVRPGTAIEEQVQCTVRYGDTGLVNFYHGFHQPGRLDRQEMRLLFERGDVTLFEWVPTRARIRALADEQGTRDLCDLFPGARLDVSAAYSGRDRACQGRHKALDVYQMIELTHGEGRLKSHVYGNLLRALLADQLAWLRDPAHRRRVTEENGRDSLAVACEADRLAHARGPGGMP